MAQASGPDAVGAGDGGRRPGTVGFLHPGEMGSALAALVVRAGARACWTPQGRSDRTRARARAAGLTECASLEALCRTCEVVVSICPPHAALEVARAAAGAGFRGLYVDANAISPARAREIAGIVADGGAGFVDAAIVGPPPGAGTPTRLYLSGAAAPAVAACLAGDGLRAHLLGDEVGRASALKICHSAMHKGQMALLFSVLAAARGAGVGAELEDLFASRPGTAGYLDGLDEKVRRAGKAWRFAGEMDEVAQAFGALGVPEGFHRAAAEVYRRLDGQLAPDGEAALVAVLDAITAHDA